MVLDTSKLGSWKTTALGAISLATGFVAFSPGLFVKWPWVTELAKYLMVGSGGLGLIAAKDSNVTGGTSPNPASNPAVVAATAVTTKVP